MAEESGQERTEQPSEKRLREAREKGQIARSREVGTAFVLMLSASALLVFGHYMATQFELVMHQGLSLPRDVALHTSRMGEWLWGITEHVLWLCTPLIAVLLVTAMLSNVVVGGVAFSGEALLPKLEKIDPIKGMGRLFSLRSLLELGKALLKFLLIAAVALLVVRHEWRDFMGLGMEPLQPALAHAASLLAWAFLWLSASLLLVAAVDVPFQIWDHRRNLKMTRQELRDELKETEGNPEMKGHLRRQQRELANRRMMEAVPRADVVLTNPTHFSVALSYDEDSMGAPRVVAKGADHVALRIREIARSEDVPVVEVPPLARAVYYNTRLDDEIPRPLYVAVAQVLAYVYQLRAGVPVGDVPEVDVPDELLIPKGRR